MTLSVDQEFAPRVKVRRRRSVLRLRQPELAYAPASLVLLYATGLMGMLVAASGLAGEDATTAGVLATPAAVATAVTALLIGPRLRRYRERNQTNVVLRIAFVWAFFGAAWPMLQIIPAMTHGDVSTFGLFMGTIRAMAFDVIVGASTGAIGGLCGGAAAVAVCVERVR